MSPGDDSTLQDNESTITYLGPGRPGVVLKPGMRLGRYALLRFLGRGGFGEVWEAEDTGAGRSLALKILTQFRSSSPDVLLRFRREGQLAASLNHPRSVYVFGAEELQGHPVIAMELMPGGTLQDQIHLRGRLPVKQAVDYILDVIDGLQAAQDAGIVHRDVKPSNCFIDEDGRAKIGDFGISKTLEPQRSMTFDEAFIGTPAYASPEQVRGRDIDFRSDIYSVGATLYSLLTGKPPFEGRNAGEFLARIVSEDPISLAERQVSVPRKLARIIARCMAKNREKRYPGYEALRAELIPFSSVHGLAAGNLVNRGAAFAIDETIAGFGISTALQALGSGWQIEAARYLCHFFYFFLSEGLWGRTPGKYLTGLRVVSISGTEMTLREALLRTVVFASIAMPVTLLEFRTGPMLLLRFVTIVAYIITMRRENGFAGLHELVSDTRVMTASKTAPGPRYIVQSGETRNARPDEMPVRLGPYRVIKDIWRSESQAFVLAFDDTLRRSVWVHVSPTARRSDDALAAVRPGRLRWLHGGAIGGLHWNAYEALQGSSLCDWVRLKNRLSWSELREILLDIAEEIAAKLDAEKAPLAISLRHIWIDHLGRPRILDFPAFMDNADYLAESVIDINTAKSFIREVLYFALTGQGFHGRTETAQPEVPLPEHARSFVTKVCRPGTASPTIGEICWELRRLSSRPSEVRRAARARMLIPTVVLPVVVLILYALAPLLDELRMTAWQRELTRVPAYDRLLRSLEDYGNLPELVERKEAGCKVLAWISNQANRAPAGKPALAQLRTFERERLQSCGKQYPAITEADVIQARKTFVEKCSCSDGNRIQQPSPKEAQAKKLLDEMIAQTRPLARFERGLTLVFWAGGLLWIFPLGYSLLFPPGAGAGIFGFTVQTATGNRAGRLRCAARSLFAWFPFVLFFPVLAATSYLGYAPAAEAYWKKQGAASATFLLEGYSGTLWTIDVVLGCIVVFGVVYSLARPARGLPDVLAGTCLVPK
jgi:hypothetical protein